MKNTMIKINAIIICLTLSGTTMTAEARPIHPAEDRVIRPAEASPIRPDGGIAGTVQVTGTVKAALLPWKPLRELPVQDTEEIILDGVSIDTVSGPSTEMPWEEDGEFTKARLRNGTNILLGGYRTVLKDPLPGEEYNVHLAASLLAGIVIKPGEVFSQNAAIGPYTREKGFEKGPTYIGTTLTTTIGGGVCKIASTLYNVAVLSNLRIVERHNHTMPVPYVPYGQDATVSYGNKDIRFMNNTGSDIMIWAQGIDNILYMAFYGSQPAPEVKWKHEVLEIIKAPVQYKINTRMSGEEQKLVLEGMDGAVVKSWVTVSTGDDTETRYMGISSYKPMPHLVERGPS
ncbi:MAG TPA: VanW family protein [Clostridia bacterium]|nr:VanW family protein [Clostridia bacterium]